MATTVSTRTSPSKQPLTPPGSRILIDRPLAQNSQQRRILDPIELFKAELQAVEDGLAALQGQYDGALKKKADLEASVDNTNKKLDRATTVRELQGGGGGGPKRAVNACTGCCGGCAERRLRSLVS